MRDEIVLETVKKLRDQLVVSELTPKIMDYAAKESAKKIDHGSISRDFKDNIIDTIYRPSSHLFNGVQNDVVEVFVQDAILREEIQADVVERIATREPDRPNFLQSAKRKKSYQRSFENEKLLTTH